MSDDDRVASILGEWQERRDRGEEVDPEEVLRAHPDLADPLRAMFEALADVERVAQTGRQGDARLLTLPLDRYADFKPAGEGGMGIVYWAIDTNLNREVAFKVIRPGGAEAGTPTPAEPRELSPPGEDTPASRAFETLKQRFLQEAWITGGMAHPGIVPVYELGQTPQGVPYYTMRFVKGKRTLADAIQQAKDRDIEERLAHLEPFLKVCDTLSYAHAKGVIHRDLKPDNVALGEFGEVVVIDWGLAKIKDCPDIAQERWHDRIQEYRDATDLRTVASAMGTPGYMAPEAAKGQAGEMDERSDVYSLGTILFQILTGRLPFEFATFGELVAQLLEEEAPKACELDPSVPVVLSDLCAACLAHEVDDRPPNADAVATAIREWQARSAADREVERLLGEATVAVAGTEGLRGAALLKPLDRASAALAQVLSRRPDESRAVALSGRVRSLRDRGARERVRQERTRLLVRGGAVVLAAALIAGVLIAGYLSQKKDEAEAAHAESQRSLAGLFAQRGREEFLAGHAGRALVYLSEAYTQGGRGAALRLLLSQASRQLGAPVRVIEPGGLLAFSPDGARLVVFSETSSQIVDSETGRTLVTLAGSADDLVQPVFGPQGERIVAAFADGTARVWSARDGSLLHALDDFDKEVGTEARSPDGSMTGASAAFSPDGRWIATAGRDRKARLWEAESGELVRTLDGHSYAVATVAFDSEGKRLLTVEIDDEATDAYFGAAHVWDVATGELLISIVSPEDAEREEDMFFVGSAVFSPDGRLIATGPRSLDPAARVWDATTGEQRARLHVSDGMIHTVAFGPHSKLVLTACMEVSAGMTGSARIWDAATGRSGPRFGGHPGMLNVAAFSPDGRRILTAGMDTAICIWDVESGRSLASLEGGGRASLGASFDPTGTRVAAVGGDGIVQIWTVGDVSCGFRQDGVLSDSPRCSSLDGRRLIAASREGVAVYDLVEEKRVTLLKGQAALAELSPDGRRALTRHVDGRVTVREIESGEVLWTMPAPRPQLRSAHLSPDGLHVLTVPYAPGTSTTLWDAGSGERLRDFGDHDQAIAFARISRDGKRILTVGGKSPDVEVRLFDVTTGERVADLPCDPEVAFSPDGSLVAGFMGPAVSVWRAHDGEIVVTFECQSMGGGHLAFSPRGTRLAAYGGGSAISVWDLETRELVATLEGVSGMFESIRFSPDGAFLLTASSGVTVWDAETGQRLMALDYPSPDFARFSPDGSRLVISRDYDEIRTWNIALEARSPREVAAFVEARVPWRLLDGRLVPATLESR